MTHEPPVSPKIAARFWSKVNKTDTCWLWTDAPGAKGYGSLFFYVDGVKISYRAHRLAYELIVGPIPEGLTLDHFKCKNKLCVNPAHLEPVTFSENSRRHWAGVTHCKWGHEFTEENTKIKIVNGYEVRFCIQCRADYNEERRKGTTRDFSLITHCKNGHEFTEENTRIARIGKTEYFQRVCKICARERMAKSRAKKRGEEYLPQCTKPISLPTLDPTEDDPRLR